MKTGTSDTGEEVKGERKEEGKEEEVKGERKEEGKEEG